MTDTARGEKLLLNKFLTEFKMLNLSLRLKTIGASESNEETYGRKHLIRNSNNVNVIDQLVMSHDSSRTQECGLAVVNSLNINNTVCSSLAGRVKL